MKKLNKELIDSLPSSIIDPLIGNIVALAQQAEQDKVVRCENYAFTNDIKQQNLAIYAKARYDVCHDILQMLGKVSALKSGEYDDK